jgi:glutathione S-transferase
VSRRERCETHVLYPGSDLARTAPRALARTLDKLARVVQLLPEIGWLGGDRPVVADFFVAEAAETVRYVFGPVRDMPLRARFPRLFEHAERVSARPAIIRERDRRPPNPTASANKRHAVERIYALDLSTLGL